MDIKMLKSIYLFSEFSDADLQKVASVAELKNYVPGQDIFSVGQEADAFYVVVMGSVKITVSTGGGDEIQIKTLGSGSHFGEMPFIDGGNRSATVQSIESSHIAEIPFAKLNNLFQADPAMALKFYRATAKSLGVRLRATTSDLNAMKELKFQQ
ncbi:Crp/Fnr family transcriptional regulator [Bdellovibrio bacteriovorus]